MWKILRQFDGTHFRRQVQIGTYYVDFACFSPSMVIEVDGGTHGSELIQSNDAVRDDYLRGRGFHVLRFWNNDVMRNPGSVYNDVERALAEVSSRGAPPTPDPSPLGGGAQP